MQHILSSVCIPLPTTKNTSKCIVQVIKQVFQKPADVLSTEVYDVLLRGELGYHSAATIFVVGMPRSGSTLVEHMLSSHPQACGAGIAALCCAVLCLTVLGAVLCCFAVLCCVRGCS